MPGFPASQIGFAPYKAALAAQGSVGFVPPTCTHLVFDPVAGVYRDTDTGQSGPYRSGCSIAQSPTAPSGLKKLVHSAAKIAVPAVLLGAGSGLLDASGAATAGGGAAGSATGAAGSAGSAAGAAGSNLVLPAAATSGGGLALPSLGNLAGVGGATIPILGGSQGGGGGDMFGQIGIDPFNLGPFSFGGAQIPIGGGGGGGGGGSSTPAPEVVEAGFLSGLGPAMPFLLGAAVLVGVVLLIKKK